MFQIPKRPRDKYSEQEKKLCSEQETVIRNHIQTCKICGTSYREFKQHGIATSPMCITFQNKLREHIDNCIICGIAEVKHNEDSIKITQEIRDVLRLMPNPGMLRNKKEFINYLKTIKGIDLEKMEKVRIYLLEEIKKKNESN